MGYAFTATHLVPPVVFPGPRVRPQPLIRYTNYIHYTYYEASESDPDLWLC